MDHDVSPEASPVEPYRHPEMRESHHRSLEPPHQISHHQPVVPQPQQALPQAYPPVIPPHMSLQPAPIHQAAPTLQHPLRKHVQSVSLSAWQSVLLHVLVVTSLLSMGMLAALVALVARIALAVHVPSDGGSTEIRNNYMRTGSNAL